MQKSKMSVWGGFTNSCENKTCEKQSRKGKIPSKAEMGDTKGTFHAKMGSIKDNNVMDLSEAETLEEI